MNKIHHDILAFPDAESFKNIVADTLKMALDKGATQAEAGLSVSQGLSIATRMREVETIGHQRRLWDVWASIWHQQINFSTILRKLKNQTFSISFITFY